MDRAHAATAYTNQITKLVADLASAGLEVSHPLLEKREKIKNAKLLVITANRGLCGGYNGNVLRAAFSHWNELPAQVPASTLEVSGKRGISARKFRKIVPAETFTHFEDKPAFQEVEVLANRYLDSYVTGELDQLTVAYIKFESASRQRVAVETLLPLGALEGADPSQDDQRGDDQRGIGAQYEFLPSAQSILEEIVPVSFKIKLFQCFLDAAVSEQIARMVAMKSATENADKLIKNLSMTYNRARQSQITSELMDILGGTEALES